MISSIPRSGERAELTPSETIFSASMSSPLSVSSSMANLGSSISIWRMSHLFFSPPLNPSFTLRVVNPLSILSSSILACSRL